MVGIEVQVVANLDAGLRTLSNLQARHLHVGQLCEIYRNLHLDKAGISSNGTLVFSVEHKLLYQTRAANVNATRSVIVLAAGCKAKEQSEQANDTIYLFHNSYCFNFLTIKLL